MITIPTRSDIYAYEQKTELDGTLYTFAFRWNNRFENWIMDVMTSEAIPIVMGIPVHVGQDLLKQFADSRLPQGTLLAINLENENDDPTIDNFGTNVLLIYNEVA